MRERNRFAGIKIRTIGLSGDQDAYLMRRLAEENGQPSLLDTTCMAAIGPVTAKAMRKLGLHVNVMPERFTLLNLVMALEAYFAQEEL